MYKVWYYTDYVKGWETIHDLSELPEAIESIREYLNGDEKEIRIEIKFLKKS